MVTSKRLYKITFPNGAKMEWEESDYYDFSEMVRELTEADKAFNATITTVTIGITEKPFKL